MNWINKPQLFKVMCGLECKNTKMLFLQAMTFFNSVLVFLNLSSVERQLFIRRYSIHVNIIMSRDFSYLMYLCIYSEDSFSIQTSNLVSQYTFISTVKYLSPSETIFPGRLLHLLHMWLTLLIKYENFLGLLSFLALVYS